MVSKQPRYESNGDLTSELEFEAYQNVLKTYKAQWDNTHVLQKRMSALHKRLKRSRKEVKNSDDMINEHDDTDRELEKQKQGMHEGFKKQRRTEGAPTSPESLVGQRFSILWPEDNVLHDVLVTEYDKSTDSICVEFPDQTCAWIDASTAIDDVQRADTEPSIDQGKAEAQGLDVSRSAAMQLLVNRRLRIRWPEDNKFYEVLVTKFNERNGMHRLEYGSGTPNASWEWVDLTTLDENDLQCLEDDEDDN